FILLPGKTNTIDNLNIDQHESPPPAVHFRCYSDSRVADCREHPPRFPDPGPLGCRAGYSRAGSEGSTPQVCGRIAVSGHLGIHYGGRSSNPVRTAARLVPQRRKIVQSADPDLTADLAAGLDSDLDTLVR